MLELEIHWDAQKYGDKHILGMYKPVPAIEMIPDWFKRLDTEGQPPFSGMTAKTCRGLFDIMTAGYIFRWPFDAKIDKAEDGRLRIYKSRDGSNHDFAPHPHFQLDGYPDLLLESQHAGIQKLKGPYKFKTPPGTSLLIKQPSYRPELRTEVMEGIVDTDGYYGDFNILFMIKNINSDRKINIKAGTPLAQIIPFVRGEWEIKYDTVNSDEAAVFDDMANNIDKFYQKHLWERKIFKDERSE